MHIHERVTSLHMMQSNCDAAVDTDFHRLHTRVTLIFNVTAVGHELHDTQLQWSWLLALPGIPDTHFVFIHCVGRLNRIS